MKQMKTGNISKPFITILMLILFTSIIIGQNNENVNKSNDEGEKVQSIKTDINTTEKMIIDRGYIQLSVEELKQIIYETTVKGNYYNGRKYATYTDKDGNMEGKNDLGSHLFGKCTFNINDNTFSVE